jgi:flagellar biogenesis protein FliO
MDSPAIKALVLAAFVALACPARADTEARALGPAPGTTSSAAGAPGASPPVWSHALRTGAALGVVIALALGGGWVIRRVSRSGAGGLLGALGAGGRAPAGVIEVLARYPVGRGATLVLLKLDRRVLLTCQTHGRGGPQGAMATLCEITDPDEVASILVRTRDQSGESIEAGFRRALAAEAAEPAPTGAQAVRARLRAMRGRSEPVEAVA